VKESLASQPFVHLLSALNERLIILDTQRRDAERVSHECADAHIAASGIAEPSRPIDCSIRDKLTQDWGEPIDRRRRSHPTIVVVMRYRRK
jgi:hypothetical protein